MYYLNHVSIVGEALGLEAFVKHERPIWFGYTIALVSRETHS
jgi:hypothetical protein